MQKVLVLGSGNAFCSDGRAQTAFLLDHSARGRLLLDCGATTLLQLNRLGADPASLDTILITHFHGDHVGGLPAMILHQQIIAKRKRPLDILGPVGVERMFHSVMDAMYTGFPLRLDLRFYELDAGVEHHIGGFQILPFPVDHQPESLGYRVTGPSGRSLAFSGDARFTERLEPLFEGVDVGILELSLEAQPEGGTSHVSLEELRAGRERIRAGRLFFNHLTDSLAMQVEGEGKRRPGFGQALRDGFEIQFYAQTMHSAGH